MVARPPPEEPEDEAVQATPCGSLRSERRCLVEGLTALGVDRGEDTSRSAPRTPSA
ncbi:MAG: hypothetical protein R3A48_16195 [Polyangiales bacterium]